MPKKDLRRVLVLGSGPIVIGQAAEFDYAGTQACQALKEEGLEVVLLNSNPATIMTDADMADRTYLEPLNLEHVRRIIARERPDGLLPTLGGQVGLNLAVELAQAGVLDEFGVQLLGTQLQTIKRAEDRQEFKDMLTQIGEPVLESAIVHSVTEAVAFAEGIGYPVIVRPGYTLGGSGGGMAYNVEELQAITARGLVQSPIKQILIEKSVAGYKEIEFEVMRDGADNCITICSMENLDPMGIHTGDSIVVAPCQTLNNTEFQRLRSASLKIIRALGVEGGCNIQFAVDPKSEQYYVIEVNPRVSRSSALASKATGYPIARVASKVAIGLTLDEIRNPVTGTTSACFEPTIDYVVMKIPRWPFDKFNRADRILGSQMKATGEVMAIDRCLEAALSKAIRSMEIGRDGLFRRELGWMTDEELQRRLQRADDERLFLLGEALRRGISIPDLHTLTGIDPFFLNKIGNLIRIEQELVCSRGAVLGRKILQRAKRAGLADTAIAALAGRRDEDEVRYWRQRYGVTPTYKMVDTCAAEFDANTPYFYSTYEQEDEARALPAKKKVLILGAGPIRIGQGIEFDYCSVQGLLALRAQGVKSLIMNNNPETVSTDFNASDRLYFEPLTLEDVLNVVEKEQPDGVIVQFGGQTAINLAGPLSERGVTILGSSVDTIDMAEDRDRFDHLLSELGIQRPPGGTATTASSAHEVAERIGFPVLVRPSYVLGGRAMEIVHNHTELEDYINNAIIVSPHRPILIDQFLSGKEVEVDAVADGQEVLIPGIMEHVERAGVHSGDSIAIYPAVSLTAAERDTIIACTTKLALAAGIKGLLNVQFVVADGQVYVLELNPRSSRTVPFLTKATGIPLVPLATGVMLGRSLRGMGYQGGLVPDQPFTAVKVPVFSWAKLSQVDTYLGPEMKSTGEVMGIDPDPAAALFKAFQAAGYRLPPEGAILATIADKDKEQALPILAGLAELGFVLYATAGTQKLCQDAGIPAQKVKKVREGSPNIVDVLRAGEIGLVINTLTRGQDAKRDGFQIRRAAAEHAVPCVTALDTAAALLRILQGGKRIFTVRSLQEYLDLGGAAIDMAAMSGGHQQAE